MIAPDPPSVAPARHQSLSRRLARSSDILLGAIAGALLFAMMTLTFLDVVMRYFFNAPIRGGFEVTEVMMAVLIFAGLPLVSRRGEHVTIDAFDGLIPGALYRPIHVVVQLACTVVLVGMAWLLLRKAASFAELGDVTQTLKIAIAPFVYGMAGLTLATAAVHLVAAFLPPPPRGAEPTATGEAGVV